VFANLVVELDERYDVRRVAQERRTLEAMGIRLDVHHGASDPVLAWIDDAFGGTWSSEANAGSNVVATRDGKPVAFATFDPQGLRFAWLRGVAAEEESGVFGPFGVVKEERGTALGPAVLAVALCELRARGYDRAVIGAVGAPALVSYYQLHTGAVVAEEFDPMQFIGRKPRTVILASGSGTNAQSVIDDVRAGLPLDLTAVVSNRANAFVLERARLAGVTTDTVVWDRERQSRKAYDDELLTRVSAFEPELVLLLGWMHLLDVRFVTAFPELLNIHPAFLPLDSSRDIVGMPDESEIPAFRGARAVRDALAVGTPWVGATMHGVTLETDRGPVYARRPLRVSKGEDESAIMERLHPVEHDVVRAAVRRWLYER
jgi:phosphoribosylglycinamide formyltransferase 1